MIDWSFDAWPAIEPNWPEGADRYEYDRFEFHVDLGCGTVKKGRIGVDRYPAPGVNVVMDLDKGEVYGISSADAQCGVPAPGWGRGYLATRVRTIEWGLPFPDNSIESIISHHCFEHIGEGFVPLMDDIYRVLRPGGLLRAITPLFPSSSAVGDPDHCRYFMEDTWLAFCGHLGDSNNPTGSWLDSFSVPYTKARFEMVEKVMTPRCGSQSHWTDRDAREIRVALVAIK